MNLILSDIEGTLTTGSSWRAFGRYFMEYSKPWAYRLFILRWLPRYLLVQTGLYSKRNAVTRWMEHEISLIHGWSREKVEEMASWVVTHEMWPKRRLDVLRDLESRQSQNTKTMLISSAYQPFAAAFGQRLGAEAIGSSLRYQEDTLRGLSLPVNAYEQKAKNVQRQTQGETIIAAYGDTSSDIPMMELSQEPVAVYPDRELRKVAVSRGWRILGG